MYTVYLSSSERSANHFGNFWKTVTYCMLLLKKKKKKLWKFYFSSTFESVCNARDRSSIPGLERWPGEGNAEREWREGNVEKQMEKGILHSSILAWRSTVRGVWWAIVHGLQRVRQSWAANTLSLWMITNNYHYLTLIPIIKILTTKSPYTPWAWTSSSSSCPATREA